MTEIFFAEGRGKQGNTPRKQALAICKDCPFTEECLLRALTENTTQIGIWGGKTAKWRIANRQRILSEHELEVQKRPKVRGAKTECLPQMS